MTPMTGLAVPPEHQCTDKLDECQQLNELADRVIASQRKLISMQQDQISDLKFNFNIVKSALREQQEEASAWYRNPMIIVPLSFVAGAVVMSQVSK
jgi:hypothetical protein